MKHPEQVRVIVTGTTDDGRSSFETTTVQTETELDPAGRPAYLNTPLWGTADGIGSVGVGTNAPRILEPWFPGPGGVRYKIFTFLPATAGSAPEASESGQPSEWLEAVDPERPGMHIHDSIDYVQVLDGEMVLEMETGEVLVSKGDVIIMRGGWHAWRNESDKACTVSSVMIGATRAQQ